MSSEKKLALFSNDSQNNIIYVEQIDNDIWITKQDVIKKTFEGITNLAWHKTYCDYRDTPEDYNYKFTLTFKSVYCQGNKLFLCFLKKYNANRGCYFNNHIVIEYNMATNKVTIKFGISSNILCFTSDYIFGFNCSTKYINKYDYEGNVILSQKLYFAGRYYVLISSLSANNNMLFVLDTEKYRILKLDYDFNLINLYNLPDNIGIMHAKLATSLKYLYVSYDDTLLKIPLDLLKDYDGDKENLRSGENIIELALEQTSIVEKSFSELECCLHDRCVLHFNYEVCELVGHYKNDTVNIDDFYKIIIETQKVKTLYN